MSWAPARLRRLPESLRVRAGAAWARHRFHRHVRPRDVFLASYPKSGRHWVGFFLASLLRPRLPDCPPPIDFHNWEEIVPNIDRMVPRYMLRIRAYRKRPDPRVFLSHHQSDPRLRRAVYLVRDPRDVVVSQYHQYQRVFPDPIRELDRFVEEFLAGRLWPGAWQEHVDGWRARVAAGGVLLLRYEDLHARTHESFAAIAEFVGLDASPEELDAALAAASFDRMRAIEEASGVPGSRGDPSERLVRRGRVGSWVEELDPGLVRRIEAQLGDTMQALGYAAGRPAERRP